MATRLESLQQIFAQALDDPEHERPLLALVKPFSPLSTPSAAQPAENAARAPTRLPVAASSGEILRRRIGLYRGNVRSHWRAALANAYPVLLALGGDAWFDALSLAYARAHPSRSGDLNCFGDVLPTFVGEYERDSRFRYFVDIARLEWSLHVASFAADVTPFTPRQWLEFADERLLDARLAVHPACAAIASDYAIADIWFAHQPDGLFPQRLAVPAWALVVRPLWQPTVLVHAEAAHAAFVALQRGNTLAAALDAAFAIDPAFDFATQWRAWIAASAITGVAERATSRQA
ncbi:DNA-binding domain-containing protein [Burkholderia guangdongensis]|uniref:HvfC/BufC N-terminal domain-containing protein n=1 Tax=Burkholderia guangdongensis TaxID=1792500 RepID=UPI0015CA9D25|nr:DNA-binding domain-containing protein [Burkholderia guangdongensis]